MGSDDSEQAVEPLATRAAIGVGIMRGGTPAPMARCVAGRLVQRYSLPELNDPSFGPDHPEAAAQMQQIAAACR